jgi:hypothetical protein
MSDMLPQNTVDALRISTDVSIDVYGMDCTLYVPNNLATVLQQDAYTKPSDYTYNTYYTKVWIEWPAGKRQLSKNGVFTEDEIPMKAHFSNAIKDPFGTLNDVTITIGSWFKLTAQYIAFNKNATSEFEIVDVLAEHMANKLVKRSFKVVARRVKH